MGTLTPNHRQLRMRAAIPGSAPLLWRLPPPLIALTFDDGPHAEGTPAVLDALAEAGVVATFFLLSERARQAPGLVRRLVAEGHEVALHADRHEALDRIPIGILSERLRVARAEIEDLAGAPVRWHRPPFGRLSWRGLQAAARANLAVALWSHDPRDFRLQPPGELERSVARCIEPGAVVLLHDGAATFPGQGRATSDCLRAVLPEVTRRGLRATTLP